MTTTPALSDLAEELNYESDQLTGLVVAANEKLAAYRLGLEVWTHAPDKFSPAFGFCRTGEPSEWQLAVRVLDGDYTAKIPLLKRSRNERVTGLELIPEIVRLLTEEAQRMVAAIRKARQAGAA